MTRVRVGLTAALAAALAGVVVVGVPVWLIQPFAPQTPAAVEWSWRFRQLAPLVTLGAAVLALFGAGAAWHGWRTARGTTIGRSVGILLVALTVSAAWFARQNHFEWKFRPFPDPRFVTAAEATDIAAKEPVLGVARGADAVAFPITRIGYHHLVNTTLGDVPIVATY